MSDIIIDKLSAKRTIENVLEKWVMEYKNIGELLNIMVAKKILLNEQEEKLGKLAPMPEGYASTDSFRKEHAGIHS